MVNTNPAINISTDSSGESVSGELVDTQSALAQSYEACINISGYFVQKLLEISGTDLAGRGTASGRLQAPL
ncbi:hypothetical protein [Microbulbifer rhizosphaerae]|uniref:Uncharacterized protein n=1 Tax=Microbulbifer rhizosphaerae TaxID=1562603 RepID=A0A7W4Z7S4_9GAMM|nr:hypothetical protein [Microbulbifer rhizosphaerae]MBB3060058.1 hypothetical protein [Microbulbifer rhizosphaerae]